MAKGWQELTAMTRGSLITIERVRLVDKDVAIEGNFELPYLARLSFEDQVFTAAFIECHGSIKDMEHTFGISYPTVKNRLDRIAKQLEFAEVLPLQYSDETSRVMMIETTEETLDELEKGEITAEEAIRRLSK
ncbi:MAG TPA: DUF2089 domain-containing protein [Dehalococcoidia bacterium]|nr:DUF2089 domain-containing protein [Dehalococcoidia bacterium]